MEELTKWLTEEIESLKNQHDQQADQQLILQGRYEAASIILEKIYQLGNKETAPAPKRKRKAKTTDSET